MNIESIRRFARQKLGYRSGPYRLARDVLVTSEWIKREGLAGLKHMRRIRNHADEHVTLTLRSLIHPFTLRPGTDDVSALVNNAIRQEYGQLSPTFQPRTIVDAGAYIGDTSAYFLSRYPEARVLAMEPAHESWVLASQNLGFYGARVDLLRAALAATPGRVAVSGAQMGARTSSSEVGVLAFSIPTLMSRYSLDEIDLLKMDIEGAEVEVLDASCEAWISKVKVLLLETHGEQIERKVFATLDSLGLQRKRFRNAWYITKREDRHFVAL